MSALRFRRRRRDAGSAGASWPAASAWARATSCAGSVRGRGARAEFSDQLRQQRHGFAQRLEYPGERASVPSSSRLTRFSIAQANSLSSRAPTMRPLPLSVWNERRTVTSASASSGLWSQTGN